MPNPLKRFAIVFFSLVFLATMGQISTRASEPSTVDWPSYGFDASETRFSSLTQINGQSIKNLGLAWSFDLPREARELEATPLAVNGVLYFTTALSLVYAIDATTGKLIWHYDPQAWKHNPRAMRTSLGASRGLAYDEGAIFVGASDGRLISLDAKTGSENWIVDTFEEKDARKQITGAPRVFKGKVIIGSTGADYGARGYVTAYNARTGARAWRFYTVPGDPSKGFEDDAQAMAAKTWGGRWWRWGGGGSVWNAITFDEELNRIYIGVGNSANYNSVQRSPGGGDNLFLASIVALDADTGKYIWHYQVNPRESWDYKATMDIILATLSIDGRPRKVLMQAPTNGFFYVIDRVTGQLISADKIGKVTWAERVDLKTGRPVEAPNIRYENGPVTFWPSPWGLHNWQAMSFDPDNGLVYIPIMNMGATYSATPQDAKDAEASVLGQPNYQFPIGASFAAVKQDPEDGTGGLIAWDPVAKRRRWTVKYPTPWNGGTLVTAAKLVFWGTGDGWLHAYSAGDGQEVWKFYASNGIIAPPMTYMANGEQYIAVLVGYGGATPQFVDPGWRFGKHVPRVLAFKVNGTARLPPSPGPDLSLKPINDASLPIDAASAERGGRAFHHECFQCHGIAGEPKGSAAPDLRESAAAHSFDAFRAIVQGGALISGGMPQFDDRPDQEIQDLFMYIRQISRSAQSAPGSPAGL